MVCRYYFTQGDSRIATRHGDNSINRLEKVLAATRGIVIHAFRERTHLEFYAGRRV